jgi:hypothetical protein
MNEFLLEAAIASIHSRRARKPGHVTGQVKLHSGCNLHLHSGNRQAAIYIAHPETAVGIHVLMVIVPTLRLSVRVVGVA